MKKYNGKLEINFINHCFINLSIDKIGIYTDLRILSQREMLLLHYRGCIISFRIYIMKNLLNSSLICEQIDVAVMGPKSLEIIEALIRYDLPTKSC